MSDITNFVKYELYPALYSRIDRAFPDMEFKRQGNMWVSPYKLNGEKRDRCNKTYVRAIAPSIIAENGERTSGIKIAEFYQQRNNLPKWIDAIRELADLCGLQLPSYIDENSYKLWREKQDRLERVATKMAEALRSDERAKDTLAYLKESRGYDEDFIKWAGLGYISPAIREELRGIFKDGTKFPYLTEAHTLAISYRSGGDVRGFVFRSIKPDAPAGDKYRDVFISNKDTKSYHLFGLTGLNLTGNAERDRDITIVEGELDALRASYFGLPNVVAASGGNVSREALQEAKRRGVKRVTLLFDADGAGRSNADRAIEAILAEGLTPFVASFPDNGEKVDADSFLKGHTAEELKEIVKRALHVSRWKWEKLWRKYEGDRVPDKTLDEFKRQTIELCNSPITKPTDRSVIISDFAKVTNYVITEADFREEADAELSRIAKETQRRETMELSSKAFEEAKNGNVEAALALLQEKLPDLSQIDEEAEFFKDLEPPTEEEIMRQRRESPIGIKTDFSFKGKHNDFRLILPSGGLALICGMTSHGKSRMLENLALQIVQNGEEGAVFYFSFEEDAVEVERQLRNAYANIDLTRYGNNLQTIREYDTTGSTKYFRGDSLSRFIPKDEEFKKLRKDGKLFILSKYNDVAKLARAITTYNRTTKVKAVFVDYVQLMRYKGNNAFGRKDELRDVCEMLKAVAKDTGLPIVLAAQLNRSTASPIDMTCQNISDASDLEHAANIVMLIWNSAVKPKSKEQTYYTNKATETLSPEALKLQERGFLAGQEGKLYAVLDKNRGGERFIDAVLDFNGNTGFIAPNYSEPQPQQEEISNEEGEDSLPF